MPSDNHQPDNQPFLNGQGSWSQEGVAVDQFPRSSLPRSWKSTSLVGARHSWGIPGWSRFDHKVLTMWGIAGRPPINSISWKHLETALNCTQDKKRRSWGNYQLRLWYQKGRIGPSPAVGTWPSAVLQRKTRSWYLMTHRGVTIITCGA